MKFRLGTRRSALAKTQSEWVKSKLQVVGVDCDLIEIDSEGDLNLKKPLYEIESAAPGLFTKQLETALIENRIDLAVHSLKDLPTLQPPELKVAAVTKRVASGDVLIISEGKFEAGRTFGLPDRATVGTSSLRREAELLEFRPDCVVKPLRGNLPTRIDAVRTGKLDAVILAAAGLARLNPVTEGLKLISLPLETFIPAPGQGALAIEVRTDAPHALISALGTLQDATTAKECGIERRILRELEGGCTLPLGVLARCDSKQLNIKAFLGVLTPSSGGPRVWKSFQRFDKSGAPAESGDESGHESGGESVVSACIAHFRPWI